MTTRDQKTLAVDRRFDQDACRHFINDAVSVLHCHHYASLYCQLADDAEIFDGKALLRKAAELAFHPLLTQIFARQGATDLETRLSLTAQYWAFAGMGTVEFERVGQAAAVARMDNSHVDEGWVKKWGQREAPVNFIGQGFLTAAMAAVLDLPVGSFDVREQASIVSGAAASRFTIVRK